MYKLFKRIIMVICVSVYLLSIAVSSQFTVSSAMAGTQQASIGQFEDWQYSKMVVLEETVGVNRLFEPVDYPVAFADVQCLNASKEIRVSTEAGVEVPSQVYNVTTYGSGYAKSCNVVFQANCTANSWTTYSIYYGNPNATMPTYPTDLTSFVSVDNITIENSHYKVAFGPRWGGDTAWTGIPHWVNYLFYKPYNATDNLVWENWPRFLMLVLNVPPYWYVPFGGPIEGTKSNITVQGPIFVEVEHVLGEWKGSPILDAVKTFRFYARIPWFTLSVDFNFTGVNFEHLMIDSYVSRTVLPYGTYRRTDGSITTINIRPDIGDVMDWDCTWIDVENTNTTDNPVGVGFIAMNGTDPWYTGWRSDRGECAPFTNGSLLEAHLKLVVLLHEGNCTVAEQLYIASAQPIPEFPSVLILSLLMVITLVIVVLRKTMAG